jgi:hypothetical protein
MHATSSRILQRRMLEHFSLINYGLNVMRIKGSVVAAPECASTDLIQLNVRVSWTVLRTQFDKKGITRPTSTITTILPYTTL